VNNQQQLGVLVATSTEVDRAIGNVASGEGSRRDFDLCRAQAKVAGIDGSAARAALKEAAKDKSKSWGNW
jgi:hypothetical protein